MLRGYWPIRVTRLLFVDMTHTYRLVSMTNKGKASGMQSVGEIIKDRMTELGMSTRDVDRLTEQAGHRVAYSTVSRITNGTYKPSVSQLEVFSKVLKLRIEELKNAAGIEEIRDPFVLPDYASKLNIEEREAVKNIIRLLAQSKDEGSTHDSHTNVSFGRFEASIPTDIAARNRRPGDPDLDDDNLLGDA